jgi:hypothetical protein
MPKTDEGIDAIIAATPDWRGDVLSQIRRVIHEADPEIAEEVGWKRPSNPLGAAVFKHAGVVCMFGALKGRVRLSIPNGTTLPDPEGILGVVTPGNKTAILEVHQDEVLNEDALRDVIRAAVERNLAKSGRTQQ